MAAKFAELPEKYELALGDWLAAHAGVKAAFGANPVRILSAVDDRSGMPCIQTGEDAFRPADRQGVAARVVTSRIHIWTRESGMILLKRIGGAVGGALTITDADGVNNGFDVAGFRLVFGEMVLEKYMRDPTENVRHGVLDFEMRFEPAA